MSTPSNGSISDGPIIDAEALVKVPANPLAIVRDPEEVIEEARRAAVALKKILDAKPKKVVFNGERYLEYEDWQTIARFYGVTAKVTLTRAIRLGEFRGFRAKAEALLVSTGQVISAAEAMCTNEEDHWRSRPVYGYKDGKRVKVTERMVPMYQLRSMAQTRACAKALRNVTAWVVVLAGYRPTPAEELPDQGRELPLTICSACGDDIFSKEDIAEAHRFSPKTLCRICLKHAKQDAATSAASSTREQYQQEAVRKQPASFDPNRGVEQFFKVPERKVAGD